MEPNCRVRYIHGIHSPEGNNNMSAFCSALSSIMPTASHKLFSYGFMGFWKARWSNDSVAKRLADAWNADWRTDSKELPEVWITHSNGHALAYLAVNKYGARPDMIIAFNPALDHNLTPDVQFVRVLYSKQDRWVDLAQYLPFHIWGNQGQIGYKGNHKGTVSFDVKNFPNVMAYEGHCGAFESKRIYNWAAWSKVAIINTLLQHRK